MRIAALGRTRILIESIKKLKESGHDIVIIGTCKDSPEYGVGPKDFAGLAKTLKADYFNNAEINNPDIIEILRAACADIAISVNWLTIIGQDVISAFPLGILNAHAGDLPRYRGNACPNWAIIEGEKEITFTIHLMEAGKLDSGPIVLKRRFPLEDSTNIGEIYGFMYSSVPEMFLEAVEGLGSGSITPLPQPKEPTLALRCYPRIPSDSYIDWKRDAEYLDRLVRASSAPFAGAYTYWNGKKLTVWRTRPEVFPCPSLVFPGQVVWCKQSCGEVGVATGNGILTLLEVQLEGSEKVKASDILKSTRIRLGMMIEDEIASLISKVELLEKKLLSKG